MGRLAISQLHRSAVLATVLLCLVAGGAADASVNAANPAALLVRAEATKISDHKQFLRILTLLQKQKNQISPTQRWHLRYLEAWQYGFEDKLDKANALLHKIVLHSGNKPLTIRAKALLINHLSRGYHYVKAFKLANELIKELPGITNARARADALRNIVQMLGVAGQYGKALDYAQQLKATRIPGESQCPSYQYEVNALADAGKLKPTSPELSKAINLCLANKQMEYANTLRLDKADLLRYGDHPEQAIALLHRIAPSILRNEFQPHIASLYATLAQAYLRKGDSDNAKKAALTTLKVDKGRKSNWTQQAAYKVLYRVDKAAGNNAAALSYYEKYVALHDAAMNNAKARALAYQVVKQEVLAKKLKLEKLTKRNRILQLQQALAKKAAETSRLLIALLAAAIILIGLWLYRLKHSQLRFRRMARHDDLTETFNRQHFIDEAKRVLQRLSKAEIHACLVIIDLDHFKRINDLYGHIAGDEVLKHAVQISRKELRASDVFGRLGGEEFGILMPACSSSQGAEIGERIRRALASTPIKLNARDTVTVSASFGLACTSISGYELVQLLIDADAALYVAKRNGRNRLIVGTGKEARFIAPDQDVSSTA